MNFDNLTDEQKERARALKDPAELAEFVAAEGTELTDEQLEAVSGGTSKWEELTNCEEYGLIDDPYK